MDETPITLDPDEQLFWIKPSALRKGKAALFGGIAALAWAAIGFVVAVVAQADQLTLHLISTLPAIMGFSALASAWMTLRTAREVAVTQEGVRVETGRGSRMFRWNEIGWAGIHSGSSRARRSLVLYDARGKRLAGISDAIENFDALRELIASQVANREDGAAQRIQLSKARRQGWVAAISGVLLLAGACFLAWDTARRARETRLLAESAVLGMATVEDRFLAPNGVTPRLVYRITGADGQTATRNAEVERFVWDALADAKRVGVVYVPDEPSISRLAFGEVPSDDVLDRPVGGYAMAAFSAAMSLFLLGAAVMLFLGWDIKQAPKTKKLAVRRYGAEA